MATLIGPWFKQLHFKDELACASIIRNLKHDVAATLAECMLAMKEVMKQVLGIYGITINWPILKPNNNKSNGDKYKAPDEIT